MSPARDATLTPKYTTNPPRRRHGERVPYIYHKDEYTNKTKQQTKTQARTRLPFRSQTGPNYIHMRATGQWHMARVA